MRFRTTLCALGLVAAVGLFLPDGIAGQDSRDTQWGIGFQSSWPSYGLSVQYDMADRITAQGILGALGTVTNFGGRLLYRFQQEEVYDIYGYGAVGLLRWGGSGVFASETSVGVGGGGGIELDWQSILTPDDRTFPPIFSSIEIGFTVASFDHYNFNALTLGGGIHYRF
jgi:hypothetical protein